jgi:hypothetical protein
MGTGSRTDKLAHETAHRQREINRIGGGKMKRYNSMWDVAFTVVTEHEAPHNIPRSVLVAGLRERLIYLEQHPEECAEAFLFSDQYEMDERGVGK